MAAAALLLLPAMHLRLTRSTPSQGEVITGPNTEIRLWFSQKPELGLTTIRLYRADSSRVELGKVTRTDDSLSVMATLEEALVPGTYEVGWKSASRDGHAVRGSYHFTVAPGPPARKQAGGN